MPDTLGGAAITGVTPGSLPQGQRGTVQITGNKTNFGGASEVSFSGAGVTVSDVSVASATSLEAMLVIDPAAAMVVSDVTVTTGSEVAGGTGLFGVTVGPTIFVSPNAAVRGTEVTVQITGHATHFDDTSVASFSGEGITVSAVTVLGPTTLRVTMTITPSAPLETSAVTVTTGEEVATGGVFTVELNPALVKVTDVSPNTAAQGTIDLAVEITGQHTNFGATSVVSFAGAGITISAYSATSLTLMEATISIDPAADPGSSDVTVTTGEEVAIGTSVFTVITSAAKAEVLREAVNTYLRQNYALDQSAIDICEEFVGNVNDALRIQASGESSGTFITIGGTPPMPPPPPPHREDGEPVRPPVKHRRHGHGKP